MEWKISSFFRSIGQKKHGERLIPKWDQILGAVGRLHLSQRDYVGNDGTNKKANSIAYFLDYTPNYSDDIPF